jgi:hypothetical protein
MILFFALLFVALAIAGATAFVIFWPLALVHVRDRHPDIASKLGTGAFLKPAALAWLLRGDYYASRDPGLSGLATPARISLIVILCGLAMAGILWLWAVAPTCPATTIGGCQPSPARSCGHACACATPAPPRCSTAMATRWPTTARTLPARP